MSETKQPAGSGPVERPVGRLDPKRDDVALWSNIVLLHLWGAIGYVKPGWLPSIAGLAQIAVLCSMHMLRRRAGKGTKGRGDNDC